MGKRGVGAWSAEEACCVKSLHVDLLTPFDPTSTEGHQLLRAMWRAIHPELNYRRPDHRWTTVGACTCMWCTMML